jgi:glycerol uptake facilitator-like aquaporin
VSTALWFLKKLPADIYGKYLISQLIGATFGISIARLLDAKLTIAPFQPVSFGAMFVAEALFTAILVLTVLSVAVSKRAVGNQYFGLAIGLALLTGQMTVAGISGAVFNPAIVLAQVISDFSHAASYLSPTGVYVSAQLTGAILAALLYAKTTEEN